MALSRRTRARRRSHSTSGPHSRGSSIYQPQKDSGVFGESSIGKSTFHSVSPGGAGAGMPKGGMASPGPPSLQPGGPPAVGPPPFAGPPESPGPPPGVGPPSSPPGTPAPVPLPGPPGSGPPTPVGPGPPNFPVETPAPVPIPGAPTSPVGPGPVFPSQPLSPVGSPLLMALQQQPVYQPPAYPSVSYY